MSRRTIDAPARVAGVGLHLGERCELTFRPAAPGRGIVFRRVDLPDTPEIPARVEQVTATERRTQLGHGAAAIHTVEHALSAVAALELDDLVIEMTGPEPPVLDGSAAGFYDAIAGAGIRETPGAAEYLTLAAPIHIVDGDSRYEAHPGDALVLDVRIDFPHPLIAEQSGRYVVSPAAYRDTLAGARTFGFVREVDTLRSKGLIRGASTQNAVVLDDTGVVENTLRWPDEFVRHKALDCMGDLALAGARVRAHVIAERPSHRGTATLVRAMVANGVRRVEQQS